MLLLKFENNANETPIIQSISATKIDEMLDKLKNTGFTSH